MKFILYALLSGLLLAFGWPTYGMPLLLFVGFVPLLYLEFNARQTPDRRNGWRVFGSAYLGFFVWNLITTYWLYYSTAAGMVFAILANTLLMALVFLVYHKIAKRSSFTTGCVFLSVLWICFEYMHLHWQFSWPWLNLGNGFSEHPNWVQWYEYTGSFGGTLWIWIGNLIVFKTLILFGQHRDKSILARGAVKLTLLIGLPIGLSYLIGNSYTAEASQASTNVLILQPDINPYTEKYNTTDRDIGRLLDHMADAHVDDSTTLVIAPETVFADGTKRSHFDRSIAHNYGEQILKKHPNTSLLSGIFFYENIHNKSATEPESNFIKPGLWRNFYNAAFMMDAQHGDQLYNKSKLVVGVENFPYQSVLKPILGDIMIDLGGTVAKLTTQSERTAFKFDDSLKTAPIICYESVYGDFVNGYVRNGAQFLSIITNDAWWKDTQGHKQHVSYARLRAIETRRDVVQSANNGTSAIIDQKGHIRQKTAYDTRAVLKGEIHLNNKKTFYVKHGDYLARIAEFLALFIILLRVFRKRQPKIT